MLLSVIVPVYNVELYLARCLASLLDQELDHSRYEIIIVNDASPDSSLEIAESYQKKYKNIKIISQENQGLSGARNTGIRNANGEYIYFIDSDDYIERNVFRNLLEVAVANDLDFLGFDLTRTPESDYHKTPDFEKCQSEITEDLIFDGVSYISKYNFANGVWWYVVRKKLLDDIGLFFEKGRMVEDGIFTTELLLNCKRAAYLPMDIYRYFKNRNSITTIKNKGHITRLNDDFKFVIGKFSELIAQAKSKNADGRALKRLKTRQESYVFFLFVRLIKAKASYREFTETISEMKLSDSYPIRNFIGIDYHSKKEKILTAIFNNRLLLFFFFRFNKIFKIIK